MKLRIFLIFFLTIYLSLNCNIDHGVEPLPGKLEVEVIFITEDIPENTQGVYLWAAPVFPPHAINELFLNTNSLKLGNDTISTEIFLPYGHYETFGLWWYNKETQSNLADIFTLKTVFSPQEFDWQLYDFDITPEEPIHRTKLYANLNRVDRDATIEGTILFNGPFPENTLVTAIAAYVQKPIEDIDYFIYLKSMDFSIDENPYEFKLPVDSRNTIRYLTVFWLPEKSGLGDFEELGFYQDGNGEPITIRLQPDGKKTGVEIHADWTLIE